MYESELFGVQLPDANAPYFVSIMGSAGQFNAVSFYDGVHAASQFLQIQERPGETRPDEILLIPHLMVSFDERQFLQPDDRQLIEDLGYVLNERKKWPVFRQVIPGYLPVFPKLPKLKDLIPVVEQTLNIARRTRREEFAFIERTKEGVGGLCRISEDGKWRDQNTEMPDTYEPVPVPASNRMAAQLNRIPKEKIVLEVDLALMPKPVMDREPAYFPFVFLLVEKKSGHIVHFELLTPHPSVDEMVTASGRLLLESLIKLSLHPQQIQTCSRRLHPVLKKVLAGTSIRLVFRPHLPSIEEALAMLMNYFKGR